MRDGKVTLLRVRTFLEHAATIRPGWHRWAVLGLLLLWIYGTYEKVLEYPQAQSNFGIPYLWLCVPPVVFLLIQFVCPTLLGWWVITAFVMVFASITMVIEINKGLGYELVDKLPAGSTIASVLMLYLLVISVLYLLRPRVKGEPKS